MNIRRLGAAAVVAAAVATAIAIRWHGALGAAYRHLVFTCMDTTAAVLAHAALLLLVLALLAGAATAFATGQSAMQLHRTRKVIRGLQARRLAATPKRIRAIGRATGCDGRLTVVDVDEPLALCHGLLRPRLMISTGLINLLDDSEIEAVVRHEMVHLRRRDPLRVVVARAAAMMLRILPFSTSALAVYCCRREMEADLLTVREMGDVVPLASALHRLVNAERNESMLRGLAVGAISATDVRIDQLLGMGTPAHAVPPSAHKLYVLAFSLLTVVAVCLFLASLHPATGIRPCIPC